MVRVLKSLALNENFRLPFCRGLIAVVILGFSVGHAFLMPSLYKSRIGILILALPMLALGAVALLRWPVLGVIAVLISTMIVPFSIGTGTQTNLGAPILILAGCAGLWAMDGLVEKRSPSFLRSKPVIPLLALLLVACIAFVSGQLPWFSGANQASIRTQLGGLALFFLSAVAYLLVGSQIKTEWMLKTLVWIFTGISSLYILGRLFSPLWNFTGRYFVYGITGSLFWVWIVSLSLSQALINRKLHAFWRLALAVLGLATIYVGLLNNTWTSGWLPACVAAVVIVILGVPRFGIFLSFLCSLGLGLYYRQASGLVMQGDNEYSLMTRMEAWQILLRMLKTSPIFGFGPANYYWYTPLFPIRGYSVVFNSHNNYIDILAQAGFLGLGCFLWFAGSLGWLGWQLRSRVPEGFQKAYVIGALGGLAGTLTAGMLGDWIIPFVYNVGYTGFRASLLGWMFLGGLMALDLMNPKVGKSQVA